MSSKEKSIEDIIPNDALLKTILKDNDELMKTIKQIDSLIKLYSE